MKVRSWLFDAKIFVRLVFRVRSSFLVEPTLNTNPKPHLHKCYHVDVHVILGTHDLVWSGMSQLPYSQWLRLHGLTLSVSGYLRPLHTWAKIHDHEVMRAQKKVNKGCPKTPPKPWSVITDPHVKSYVTDPQSNAISIRVGPRAWWNTIN
jgi:hypothetical protein